MPSLLRGLSIPDAGGAGSRGSRRHPSCITAPCGTSRTAQLRWRGAGSCPLLLGLVSGRNFLRLVLQAAVFLKSRARQIAHLPKHSNYGCISNPALLFSST